MIEVKNLYHDYEGKGKFAVSDVSFNIGRGEIFGFLGPSGAGKSTVQNIMIGLLKLQRGEVKYEGKPIQQMDDRFFNEIGVSFEHPNLYGKLSGYENLKYFAGLFDVKTKDPRELLNLVGLSESEGKKASTYSKGMKQRLVFARALINNPKILFLDEPTSGLDPSTAGKIKDIILQKKKEGTTIFLTTHNMFIAEELCDRVAFINEGKIVALDAPKNLKLQFGEKSVKIEYKDGNTMIKEVYFLDNPNEKAKFNKIIADKEVITLHSQEATLEQIFIKITGRVLG